MSHLEKHTFTCREIKHNISKLEHYKILGIFPPDYTCGNINVDKCRAFSRHILVIPDKQLYHQQTTKHNSNM